MRCNKLKKLYQAAPQTYKQKYADLIKQQLVHLKKIKEISANIEKLSNMLYQCEEKIKNTTSITFTEEQVKEMAKEMNTTTKEFNKKFGTLTNMIENIEEEAAVAVQSDAEIDQEFEAFINNNNETVASEVVKHTTTVTEDPNSFFASLDIDGLLPTTATEPPPPVSESKREEKKELEVDFDY